MSRLAALQERGATSTILMDHGILERHSGRRLFRAAHPVRARSWGRSWRRGMGGRGVRQRMKDEG
jgi:hypothetical protein